MPRTKQRRLNFRRKPKGKMRRKKPLALKPHNFVEKFEQTIALNSTTVDGNGTLSTGYGRYFTLDDIAQVASYKDLFDSFVIRKVVAEIRYDVIYTNTTLAGQEPLNPIYPILLLKNDHNDVAPNSYASMLESAKTRQVQLKPGVTIKHVLKPAAQVEAYKTALASAFRPKWNCELRSADSATPHYGLKVQCKTQPGNANINMGQIHITYRMYFSMKNND